MRASVPHAGPVAGIGSAMMVRKKASVALVVGAGGSHLPTGNSKPPKHSFNTKNTKNHKGGTKAVGMPP